MQFGGAATDARTALVTGSTSGIGLGIAEHLAARGIRVMVHGLDPGGDEIARRLGERHGVPCRFDGTDLCAPDAAGTLVRRCVQELGGLDIVVNNAGIQHVAPVEDFPRDRWDQVLQVNLSAAFYLAQAAWPEMRARCWGRVINVASVHGLRASEFKVAYIASKHGLIGLTKALAVEGADVGITANAICPGFVETPLVERQIEDQARFHGLPKDEVVRSVLLKKQAIKAFVPVAAVAEMAGYLASDVAACVTGSVMTLDGGWTCQ